MQKKKYFGQYEMLSKVAQGSGGIVYKVRHKDLGQIYALKILQADQQKDQDRILRFIQEAKTTARLSHPHIIQVIDAGQQKQYYYLVMEFIEGKTLEDHIHEKIPFSEGLKWIRQILSALSYAHQQGVIHRDIKPRNILITQQGDAKIGDFGLAQDKEFGQIEFNQISEVLGTPAYMSPEQAAGKISDLDQTSDIYSVGACLYQICTGHRPFESDSLPRLLYQIIVDEPAPPSRWNPTIPRDLERIILKAIAKEKEKRYPTDQAFTEDIERFLQGYPVYAYRASSVERFFKWSKRNPLFLRFALIFLIGAFGLFFFFEWRQSREYQQIREQALKEARKIVDQLKRADSISIETLLSALNQLNIALSFASQDRLLQQEKWTISQKLMHFACEKQQYQLAEYLTQEIKTLEILSNQEKKEFSATVESKKQQRLKEHLARLDFWLDPLKKGSLNSGERERAIFEISGMPEQEIQDKILEIFGEGTRYFLENPDRSFPNEDFYKAIVQILGRMENPEIGPLLFSTLKQLNEAIQGFDPALRSISKIQYLISLAQSVSHHRVPGVALQLKKIRRQFGKNSFFSDGTELAYKTLANLDGLHRIRATTLEELCQRGLAKMDQRDWVGAIEDYTEAIRQNPRFEEAWRGRASAEASRENWSAAISDATQALQLNPKQPVVYSNRGNCKEMLSDFKGAIDDLNQAILLDPQLDDAYGSRGLVYFQQENYVNALNDFNKSIELNPQDVNHYFDRGQLKQVLGDLLGALKDYDQALQMNPDYREALIQRSRIKEVLDDLSGALTDLDQALIQDPKSKEAYLYRAGIKKSQGDSVGAIRDYQELIRFNLEKNKIPYYRALIKELQKDSLGAIQEYTQAIRLNPQETAYYNQRGLIYMRQSYWKEALQDFTQAIQKSTSQKGTYYSNRGHVHFDHGNFKDALEDYTQAIQWDPFDAEHYFYRAGIRYIFEDFTGALEDYYASLYYNHKTEAIYYLLGYTYSRLQQKSFAEDSFLRFLLMTETTSNSEIQEQRQDIQKKIQSFLQQSTELVPVLKQAYVLFEQGFQEEKIGHFAVALNKYKKTLQLDPKNPLFLFRLCKTYEAIRSWDQLIPLLEQELSQRSDPAMSFLLIESYLQRGSQFLREQHWSSAKNDFLRYQYHAPLNHSAQKQVQEWLQEISKKK